MAETIPENFDLILPVGTQIVTRVEITTAHDKHLRQPRGAVGRIIAAPIDHTHRKQNCIE